MHCAAGQFATDRQQTREYCLTIEGQPQRFGPPVGLLGVVDHQRRAFEFFDGAADLPFVTPGHLTQPHLRNAAVAADCNDQARLKRRELVLALGHARFHARLDAIGHCA